MVVNYHKGIVEYFKKNISKGYAYETLKIALVNQGYSKTSVEKAGEQALKELSEKVPTFVEKPIIKYNLYDENDNLIKIKNQSWWRKLLGL